MFPPCPRARRPADSRAVPSTPRGHRPRSLRGEAAPVSRGLVPRDTRIPFSERNFARPRGRGRECIRAFVAGPPHAAQRGRDGAAHHAPENAMTPPVVDTVAAPSSTPAAAAPPSPPQFELTPPATALSMTVTKRNGRREPVDLNKIVRAVQRAADGLYAVDAMRGATRTISGLYDGATTRELDELSIRTAALLTAEEPEYGRLGARLLAEFIAKEVSGQEIHAFSQSIARGHETGLINDRLLGFVQQNARKLNDALDVSLDLHFDYFGLRTLYDRYLLRHPHTRK